MLKVSEHIDNCAKHLNPKYFIFPFYKMYTESQTLRKAKEKFFINKLKPKLNDQFSTHCAIKVFRHSKNTQSGGVPSTAGFKVTVTT